MVDILLGIAALAFLMWGVSYTEKSAKKAIESQQKKKDSFA